jgi:hypothetical protein
LAKVAFASCFYLSIACSNDVAKDDDPEQGKAGSESTSAGTGSSDGGGNATGNAGAAPEGGGSAHAGANAQGGHSSGRGVVRLNLRAK